MTASKAKPDPRVARCLDDAHEPWGSAWGRLSDDQRRGALCEQVVVRLRTIARNARVLKDVVATAVSCESFTLDNGFAGREVALTWVRERLLGEISSRKLRVRQDGPTKFCVQYHSNHWLEVTTAG